LYHLFFLISLAPALLIAHRFRARSFPRVDAMCCSPPSSVDYNEDRAKAV